MAQGVLPGFYGKQGLPRILSIGISCFAKVTQHTFRKNALMRALDNLQKIGYTNFSSLDRVKPLELRARLAAIFLSSTHRMDHIICFKVYHTPASLFHSQDGHKFPSYTIRSISGHSVGSRDSLCFVGKSIDRNGVFHHIPDYRTQPGVGKQAVQSAV